MMNNIRNRVRNAIPDGDVVELPQEWLDDYFPIKGRRESPSSVTEYMTCPLKWWMNRYAPIVWNEEYNFAAVVGNFVHRVMEVFYSELPKNRSKEKLLETFQHAITMLQDHNTKDGVVDTEMVHQYKWLEDNADQVTRYIYPKSRTDLETVRNGFYSKARKCIINSMKFDLDPAKLNVISTESWLRGEKNGIRINGKIDRIILTSDDRSIVDDYKTGKTPKIEPDEYGKITVDVLDPTFIPVGMYAWMKNADPSNEIPVKSVRLLYLGWTTKFVKKINPEVIETVDTLLDEVSFQMNETARTGRIMMTPSDSQQTPPCSWCLLVEVCPAWTGAKNLDDVREEYGV